MAPYIVYIVNSNPLKAVLLAERMMPLLARLLKERVKKEGVKEIMLKFGGIISEREFTSFRSYLNCTLKSETTFLKKKSPADLAVLSAFTVAGIFSGTS